MVVDLAENPTPLLLDVSTPIPGDNPVGEDISYDDDFLALKDQIDQLSSVSPEGIDFDEIVATCQMLLGQKAKDLRVATYLAMALAKTQGYRGVLEGLEAQRLLVEGYWEAMYPPLRRMRARQAAFQFMAERLGDEVKEGTPGPGDHVVLTQALDALKALQDFTMEAMGEDAPALSGLRKTLDDALRKAPAPEVSTPEAAPAEEAAPVTTPVSTAAPTVAAPSDTLEESEEDAAADGAPEDTALDALQASPTPLLLDVSTPIPGDNPVGEDISYDDDFLALKDQIDQLSSVSPEGIDFDEIVATCQMLLGQKAKDLRVATYLAMALAKTQGYRGVLEGLEAQRLLVEGYWEAMYPPLRRMRARQAAFQFMAERLGDEVEEITPTVADKDIIEGTKEVLKSLQSFTMEAMGEDAPTLSGLRKTLDDALRKVPKPKPVEKKAPPPATATPSTSTPSQASASPAARMPAATVPQSATDALDAMMDLAVFLREDNPANPTAYRLARSAQWDTLLNEPDHTNRQTLLPDLEPHRLTYLNTLVEEANWAALLTSAEDLFKEAPYHFLLDVQRFVASAMDGLGADYQLAKQAVLFETAILLKRVPELPKLTYMDGMPFAAPATQFWIEQTVEPVMASGGGGGMGEGEDKALTAQHDKAKQLFAEGNLPEALGVLQEGAKQDGAPRSRFQRRYYMALLCMQGNQPDMACSMLEELDREIERLLLADWEPNMALEVWTSLHRCYGLIGDEEKAPDVALRARRIIGKIAQIDVTRALKAGES